MPDPSSDRLTSRTGLHNGPTNRWLVVVYPPRDAVQSPHNAIVQFRAPAVKWVTADTEQEAAEQAGVGPGERAEVCNEADVFKFKRPKEAPLVAGESL